jgi:hypothetical protein
MSVLSAVCIPSILGFLTLAALLRDTPFRRKDFFLLSASIPTGLGICSLLLFVSLLLSPLYAKPLSIGLSLGLIFLLLFRLRAPGTFPKAVFLPEALRSINLKDKASLFKNTLALAGAVLFLYTAFTIIQFYFLSVSTNIGGGWDARYFWALKAKFMFRDPAEWQLMFSQKLPWSNQGYPLLWPGTLAWGWHSLGQESPLWGPFAALCFYIPCALLVVWYLAAHHTAITGWLGGSFALVLLPPLFWAIHQYADVPLAFFMTACGLTLVSALRLNAPGLFMISGLMGGLAAWTKNEGILFVVWIYLLLGAALWRHPGKNMKAPLRTLGIFALGTLGPLLAVGTLKYLARNAGVPINDLQHPLEFLSSGMERSGMILKAFFDYMNPWTGWKGLWGFFILAALLMGFKRQGKSYEGLLFLIVLLTYAGYFAVLLITSPDLPWQIQTALDRLILHASFLATAFVFEMLTFDRNIPPK